jgi:o-succinylbenzoate synthase
VSNTSFTIDKITLREIHLDLVEPFRTDTGIESKRRILLIEITDTDGATAWGECVALETPHYLPETIDTAWSILTQHIVPQVLGHTFNSVHEVTPYLDAILPGNNMAKAAIEMTCWALTAEKQGISLSKVLGGTRTQISTGIALGLQDSTEQLIEKIQHSIQQGYARIKLKVEHSSAIKQLQAVRDALGDDVPLMIDANCAYTLDDIEHLHALDQFNLIMIEQPLARDDLASHAQIQEKLTTPICLDESLCSLSDAQDMHTLQAGRIMNLKPGRVAGLTQSLAIHNFAQQKNIPLWCGGMLETGIGRAYNVALAALPGFTLPGDLSPSRRYWKQDIVTPEWDMYANGMVQVPRDKIGLGVDIHSERIEKITVRKTFLKNK